jgi:hypothetical protein
MVKNFKVNWNEAVKLDIPCRPQSTIAIELAACELDGNESSTIGMGSLSFLPEQHGKLETWTLLLEQSKINASIRLTTWFGESKP